MCDGSGFLISRESQTCIKVYTSLGGESFGLYTILKPYMSLTYGSNGATINSITTEQLVCCHTKLLLSCVYRSDGDI